VSSRFASSAPAGRSPLGAAARAAGVLAALALLGCGAEASPQRGAGASSQAPGVSEPASPAGARDPEPRRREADVANPRRIEIPAIGVSAPVIALGLNADKTLEVPEDYGETGWWKGGPEPGEPGPAVIAGHVDSETGPAVFYRLEELRAGDEIRVHRADGTRARFIVARLERHPKDDFPTRSVYAGTREPTLRLVTCSGDFDTATGHYVDNTIVFADAA
jgi:LPXTG-site transpeptidase (sortase) family protein